MLERISWSFYWLAIVIVLAIYYSILLVLLYQKGFFSKSRVKPDPASANTTELSPAQPNLFGYKDEGPGKPGNQNAGGLPVDDGILMPLVHDLIQELKEFIGDIAQRSFVKEEVIMGIQIIVKNYKKLEGSPYQKSINDFIKNEVEDACSIHLSEEDIKKIWIG